MQGLQVLELGAYLKEMYDRSQCFQAWSKTNFRYNQEEQLFVRPFQLERILLLATM